MVLRFFFMLDPLEMKKNSYTPPQIKMEPEKRPLEKVKHLQATNVQLPC